MKNNKPKVIVIVGPTASGKTKTSIEIAKKLNVPIKKMKFKDGVLIVAILRGRHIIFPNGMDEIREKDTIVVIDNNSSIKDINDILE